MNKFLVDGRTAIIVPDRHGARWYTYHGVEELLFDPVVIEMVTAMNESDTPLNYAFAIEKYCDETYGEKKYYGDAMYLTIDWLPTGTFFSILVDSEGFETIVSPDEELGVHEA